MSSALMTFHRRLSIDLPILDTAVNIPIDLFRRALVRPHRSLVERPAGYARDGRIPRGSFALDLYFDCRPWFTPHHSDDLLICFSLNRCAIDTNDFVTMLQSGLTRRTFRMNVSHIEPGGIADVFRRNLKGHADHAVRHVLPSSLR